MPTSQLLTPEDVRALFNEGKLLASIEESSQEQESQLEEICIELHNSAQIDMLALVESNEFDALQGWPFFSIQQFFVEIIPHIKSPIDKLASCITKLVQKAGSDGAANMPNGSFIQWCRKNNDQALTLIKAIEGGDNAFTDYFGLALQGIGDLNRARNAASIFSDNRRLAALTAIARLPHGSEAERASTVAVVAPLINSQSDDTLRATALCSIVSAFSDAKIVLTAEALNVVRSALSIAGEGTLYQSAAILFASKEALSLQLVNLLLEALLKLNPAHGGTIRNLDMGLRSLMQRGYAEQAVDFITKLLSQDERQFRLKQFPGFSSALLEGSADVLNSVVVRWLRLGDGVLCVGLEALFRRRSMDESALNIEIDKQDLTDEEVYFVCRKAIGFFCLQPVVAASILLSAIRTSHDPLAADIKNLLFDPLLINFGGKLRAYLNQIASTDQAFTSVQEVLNRADAYITDLSSVGPIKELRPSEHRRELARARSNDQMHEAMKGAQEETVLLKLVKKSTLLHGRQTFSFFTAPGQERRPVEMTLHSHSVGFELPRQEIADSVGLDETITKYRLERLIR